jgi:hypothetical protein
MVDACRRGNFWGVTGLVHARLAHSGINKGGTKCRNHAVYVLT